MTALADQAVQYGYAAWAAAPDDGRLLQNLRVYVAAQGIPTYACIPKVKGQRDGMTSVLVEQLATQGVQCFVNEADGLVTEKWNRTLDLIEDVACDEADSGIGTDGRYNVLVINNDVTVGPDFVTIMCAALRSADDIGAVSPVSPTGEGFAGWCHMMRAEDDRRYDAQFRHWYSDTDMWRTIVAEGQRVITCRAPAEHLHPNEATFGSSELLAISREDEARFAAKWGVDPATLFLARNPQLA